MGLMPAFMRRLFTTKPATSHSEKKPGQPSPFPLTTFPRTEPCFTETQLRLVLSRMLELSRDPKMGWCAVTGGHNDYRATYNGDLYGVTIRDFAGSSPRIKTIFFQDGKTGEMQCYDLPSYTLTSDYLGDVSGRRTVLVVRSAHLARHILNSVEASMQEAMKPRYLDEIPPPPKASNPEDLIADALLFAFASSIDNKPAESESANDLTTKGGDFTGAGASDSWSADLEPACTYTPEPKYEAPTYTAGDSGSSYESSSDSSGDSSPSNND